MKHIHITSGDPEGIGLEITLKALCSMNPPDGKRFYLWRSSKREPDFELFSKLKSLWKCEESFELPFKEYSSKTQLVDMELSLTPARQVIEASKICLKDKNNSCLVTAPLSKTQIKKEGFNFKGHTDILKEVSKTSDLFMCFLGDKFNVVLATDHQPLKQVEINRNILRNCIQNTFEFRKKLVRVFSSKKNSFQNFQELEKKLKNPIAVLGLNPHAGEEGILGNEEQNVFSSVLNQYSKKDIKGPLVPDTAFQPQNWNKYSFYISSYHDQGLIPFKMVHFRSGVHVTLGLPFVRTSVDHGTAKNVFGKNQADETSIKKAIELSIVLMKDV